MASKAGRKHTTNLGTRYSITDERKEREISFDEAGRVSSGFLLPLWLINEVGRWVIKNLLTGKMTHISPQFSWHYRMDLASSEAVLRLLSYYWGEDDEKPARVLMEITDIYLASVLS